MDNLDKAATLDDIERRVAEWRSKILEINPNAKIEVLISQHYYYKHIKPQNQYVTLATLYKRYEMPVIPSGDTREGVRITIEI